MYQDTIKTLAIGSSGVIASTGTSIVIPPQDHTAAYIQVAIAILTTISLIIQTFFKKDKKDEK